MDELIKRLRAQAVYLPEKFSKNAELLDVLMKAADAIEELLSKLNHDDAQIQSLVEAAEERRWIPVTERLPENGQDVLVWVSIGKAPIVAYDVDCYNEHAKRWVCFENDVTHWMPLPPAPKEET